MRLFTLNLQQLVSSVHLTTVIVQITANTLPQTQISLSLLRYSCVFVNQPIYVTLKQNLKLIQIGHKKILSKKVIQNLRDQSQF
jgi:hypothetical protein